MRRNITSLDSKDLQEKTLLFNGDIPGGGMSLICKFCDKEIEIYDNDNNCPNCRNDLLFPTWTSW